MRRDARSQLGSLAPRFFRTGVSRPLPLPIPHPPVSPRFPSVVVPPPSVPSGRLAAGEWNGLGWGEGPGEETNRSTLVPSSLPTFVPRVSCYTVNLFQFHSFLVSLVLSLPFPFRSFLTSFGSSLGSYGT